MIADDDTELAPSRGSVYRWYYLAAALFLLITCGPLNIMTLWVFGGKIAQGFNVLQMILSIALFCRGYKMRGIGTGGIIVLCLVGFLFLSVLWSVDPTTSLRRAIVYLFFVLAAIGISANLDGDEYMALLRTVFFLAAAESLVLWVVSPGNALMEEGALRGVFPHKNVLAQVMAVGVLASLHGLRVGSGRRWVGLAMIAVFTFATLAAKSGTSLMTVVLFCSADRLAALLGRGGVARLAGIALIVVGVPVFAILAIWPDVVLEALGKDPTLTGRTELWELVIVNIWARPVLGWGFDAFWSQINPYAVAISHALGWGVGVAHNGLLEMLLEVGAVGTVLFLSIFVRNIAIAVRCLRTTERQLAISLLLCCLGILLVSVTEEVLVDPSQVSVGVLFISSLICERTLRAARDGAFADANADGELLYDGSVYEVPS